MNEGFIVGLKKWLKKLWTFISAYLGCLNVKKHPAAP